MYPIDPEDVTEMMRLLGQDRLMTERVSGLLPPRLPLPQRILDLGCGPGGWALDIAAAYPNTEVIGVDTSHRMIEYASTEALARGIENARFEVQDFQSLSFPQDWFDFVNARLVSWFAHGEATYQEWSRVVRPGGTLRLIEGEIQMTNSLAFEKQTARFLAALHKRSLTVSPDGRHHGITLTLRRTLQHLGYSDILEQAAHINFSADTPDHDRFVEDITRGMVAMREILGMKPRDFEQNFTSIVADVKSPGFLGIGFFLTCWGIKSEGIPSHEM